MSTATEVKEITLAEYGEGEPLYVKDWDEFFSDADGLRDAIAFHGKWPSEVRACERLAFRISAASAVEMALQDHHDGATVSSAETKRLQAILDDWCTAQKLESWLNTRIRVVLPTEWQAAHTERGERA